MLIIRVAVPIALSRPKYFSTTWSWVNGMQMSLVGVDDVKIQVTHQRHRVSFLLDYFHTFDRELVPQKADLVNYE